MITLLSLFAAVAASSFITFLVIGLFVALVILFIVGLPSSYTYVHDTYKYMKDKKTGTIVTSGFMDQEAIDLDWYFTLNDFREDEINLLVPIG